MLFPVFGPQKEAEELSLTLHAQSQATADEGPFLVLSARLAKLGEAVKKRKTTHKYDMSPLPDSDSTGDEDFNAPECLARYGLKKLEHQYLVPFASLQADVRAAKKAAVQTVWQPLGVSQGCHHPSVAWKRPCYH